MAASAMCSTAHETGAAQAGQETWRSVAKLRDDAKDGNGGGGAGAGGGGGGRGV